MGENGGKECPGKCYILTIMRFEFATATRIVFGSGSVREAVSAAASLGNRVLLVCGGTPERSAPFISDLRTRGLQCAAFSIAGEPTIAQVSEGVRAARDEDCGVVIGFGGGSALDGAKAIAALLSNAGDPLDYLEVVGKGNPLTEPCAPCICIPTTAGTGSEVTRNAVLFSPEHKVKVSLRSPKMLPVMAVVDPDLTHSVPPSTTAATGIDALTQLIEPFVCSAANPMTQAICREGIRRAALWLRVAHADGCNAEARENMALASLFGGLALANAGLGAVHGLAAPLGGTIDIPHGSACSRLLPIVMEANIRALNARARHSPALSRYDEIAHLLTGSRAARASDGVDWVYSLGSDLSIPRLSTFGLKPTDVLQVAQKAQASSSMRGNPVPLTGEELIDILEKAI
jgi:alcohol dehydrogenase class IV